jgi:hypothetical protein
MDVHLLADVIAEYTRASGLEEVNEHIARRSESGDTAAPHTLR